MAQIENLEVLIQANADQLRTELQTTQNALKKFNKNVDKSTSTTSNWGKTIRGLGVVAGLGLATKAVIGFGKASISMAMDAVESENLVGVTFGRMTGEIVEWSQTLQDALGINEFASRKTAGVFFNIANSMGMTEENALRLAKGITVLGYDLASFYNLSTDDALQKLQSGLTGEIEPLRRLGILVDENTIKVKAMELGLGDNVQAMSQATRASLRYLVILDQTQNAQGDMARTLTSPANQLRVLQSRLEGAKIALGAVFIPVLNAVIPYLVAFVVVIGRAIEGLAKLWGIAGVRVDVKAWESFSKATKDYGSSAVGASKGVSKLKKELLGLAGFDEMNVLTQPDAKAGSGSGLGGGSAVDIPEPDLSFLDDVEEKSDGLIEKIQKGWDKFIKGFGDFFKPISDAWEKWVMPLLGQFQLAWDDLVGVVKASPLGSIFKILGQIIGVVVVGAIALVISWFTMLVRGITIAIDWFNRAFYKAVDFVTGVILLVRALPQIFQNVFNMASEKVQNAFIGIGRFFSNIWDNVKSNVKTVTDWIVDKFNGVTGAISKIGTGIWNSIKRGLNWFIDNINHVLGSINRSILKNTGIRIAGIPRLAQGGVVSSPTLAQIGENGKEVVMPLERNTGWIDELANKINGSGGSKEPINLTVQVGSKTIAKEIIDVVNGESLRSNSLVFRI